MEQAIQPATAAAPTAVLPGGGEPAAPAPRPAPKPKHPALRVLGVAADLRITVGLFALAMLIVFWGTLAQVDHSVWNVQLGYFRSWIAFIPIRTVLFNLPETSPFSVPFPGGWLIGAVMLVNLLAAHAVRFKFTWNRGGIILIHAGLIVMMLSEVITGLYAVEGSMPIKIGRGANGVTHPNSAEFAVIRTINAKEDKVVTVPRHFLEPGKTIDNGLLPFKIEVESYMPNSDLRMARPIEVPADAKGNARSMKAVEKAEVAGVSQNQSYEYPAMYARLRARDGKDLGLWLFSAMLDPERIAIESEGKTITYQVALRFKQTQRDFVIHLEKFTHDTYPGTNTPKDFRSTITLTDEKGNVLMKDVDIYMNHPFTYKGETFYQQSWTKNPLTGKADGTVLQVVHNPGSTMPYISCFMVGIGMLYHFGITLFKFVDRRGVR